MNEAVVSIFHARRVITMTSQEPEAFAVLGERIVATGSVDSLAARFPEAERVDFGGGVVVPGFNDAHMHPSQVAEDLLHLDASPKSTRSIADLKAALLRQAAEVPSGRWIRASRYDDSKMAEGRTLSRADLDEVTPNHPVLVVHVSGHWAVANSKALEAGGIDDASEAPPGGEFGRDATGRLNGILYEQAMFNFAYPSMASGPTVIPPSTVDEKLEGLARALKMFNAAGLTSVGDALVGPKEMELYLEAERRGMLTLRVNLLVTADNFDAVQRLGLRTGFGSHWLRFGGVKTFVDGAVGGRTLLLEQPSEGMDHQGIQVTPTKELADIVRRVHEAGSRLAVHANGDRAISMLLDMLESAQEAHPRMDAHHRIEHCTVVTEEILRRMKRLGAIAVPFGSYVAYYGGKFVEWYGADRVEHMFAHRSFLDAGIPVAGSSDYFCGPFEPLLALQSCVTRRGSDGVVVGANQRITPYEAISLYTTGSAYASHEQDVKGRLAPGYLADFVVLGEDPLTTDPDRLAGIPVMATYVGGKRVWTPS